MIPTIEQIAEQERISFWSAKNLWFYVRLVAETYGDRIRDQTPDGAAEEMFPRTWPADSKSRDKVGRQRVRRAVQILQEARS